MENKKNILPFIAVFVITAALASIIIWYVLNKNTEGTPETPVVTDVTPTMVEELPTPTAEPTIAEVSKTIKLQVLNATDINGQAATLKERLAKLGFTSIAVGNGKDKLTENKLQLKASQASASAYFVQELAGFFDVVPTTDLPETSTYDAVFSIGTKLDASADTAAPSQTSPTPKVTKATTTVTPSATTTRSATTATPSPKATGTIKPSPTTTE